MQISEVKISRILNPTSIDLGEFVINPYMGCEFSCLYCYVRSNRVISRKNMPWGEYVDVRINAPDKLEKELLTKRPKTVLLGSTTECFQPAERKYNITKKVLEILNRHKIRYVILTRSPYILDALPLLKEGFCDAIYFTVNEYGAEFKNALEPKAPAFSLRREAVNALLEEKLPVTPYFSPLLPWISDYKDIFHKFGKADIIEFECLNFRLVNIIDLINRVASVAPEIAVRYRRMLGEEFYYAQVWSDVKGEIKRLAREAGKSFDVYVHGFGSFFENKYAQKQIK